MAWTAIGQNHKGKKNSNCYIENRFFAVFFCLMSLDFSKWWLSYRFRYTCL